MRKIIPKIKYQIYAHEGERIPRFYLPVRWRLESAGLECWFFLIAPFVWVFYTGKNACWGIIKDGIEWEKLLEQKVKGFKNTPNK